MSKIPDFQVGDLVIVTFDKVNKLTRIVDKQPKAEGLYSHNYKMADHFPDEWWNIDGMCQYFTPNWMLKFPDEIGMLVGEICK